MLRKKKSIDLNGRITIPSSFRKILKIQTGDELEFILDSDQIIIRKTQHYCAICGNKTDRIYKGRYICKNCVADNLNGSVITIS